MLVDKKIFIDEDQDCSEALSIIAKKASDEAIKLAIEKGVLPPCALNANDSEDNSTPHKKIHVKYRGRF